MSNLLSLALLLFLTCCHGFSNRNLINYSVPLDRLLDSLDLERDMISIYIDKSNFVLSVRADTTIIKQYPVVLGGNPVDDKLRQGDQCTPEGIFLIQAKYPHKNWEKFIWINYPTEESWQKHRKAKEAGVIDAHVKIGGEIGIHGVPEGTDGMIDLRMNWTLGCISLKNKDINDFYPFVSKGTRVIIQQ
jgi:murein L,D-transpeptidase YafK